MGRHAAAIRADVRDAQQCLGLVDQTIAQLGRVDILVNNAGITFQKDFFEITPEEWDDIYHLNLRGQFFCAQGAARNMRENGGGVIINMLSIHGLVSFTHHSLYDGTKGAIAATTRELSIELAPYHIRVVGVAPGCIEVPRYYTDRSNYDREAMGRRIPIGHVGMPLDVAKTCAFLASEDARFIDGTTIVVDGGTTSRMSLFVDGA